MSVTANILFLGAVWLLGTIGFLISTRNDEDERGGW